MPLTTPLQRRVSYSAKREDIIMTRRTLWCCRAGAQIPSSVLRHYRPRLSTTNFLHCVSEKKLTPLNPLKLCQILTDIQSFCSAGKRKKFATKSIRYPPHLRHVATLPWQIKISNFLQMWKTTHCILVAFNFVIYIQIC